MKLSRLAVLAMLIAIPLQEALAADWQLVLSDRNRRVEIDRSSIFSSDRGTKVSWGRVVLTSEEAASSGYATIKALNRYDCQSRTFLTVKRVYLDSNEHVVREEPVADQTPLRVTPNSVDERMWREVCNPPSAADLQKIASEVQKLAVAAQPAPKVQLPATKAPELATTVPVPSANTSVPAAKVEPKATQPVSGDMAQGARPSSIDARDTSVRPVRTAETPEAVLPTLPEPAADPDASPQGSIVPPLPRIKPSKPEPKALDSASQTHRSEPAPRAEAAAPLARDTAGTPPSLKVAAAPHVRPTHEARKSRVLPALAMTEPGTGSAPVLAAVAPPAATAAPDAVEALLRARHQNPFDPGWSYEGEAGPEAWGRLRPDWRTCSEGLRQSPIDLREGLAVDLAPIKFHYRSTGFRIRDTGNTVEVDIGGGMGMELRGVRYELERLSLHRPSQERIGGMAFDMSMYLEHRSADGRTAILSVLLTAGAESNLLLQTLLNNLPLDRGREFVPDAIIDLAAFLPDNPAHFLYMGSLPTPPCTEDVIWAVMKTPVGMSEDQLAVFSRLYPRNTRPIQPTNGRPVMESR